MELIKNIKTGGFWPIEGEVYFQLFKRYIQFAVEDAARIEYIQTCAEFLNSLSPALVQDLCLASIRYCNDFLEMIGEPPKPFSQPTDVLPLVHPSSLIVPNPENSNEPILHMELNCDWEVEHGMEWIIRGDKVLYVGGFNGQNPWADYSVKQSWNYA